MLFSADVEKYLFLLFIEQCWAIWIKHGDFVFIGLTSYVGNSFFALYVSFVDVGLVVDMNEFILLLDGGVIFEQIFGKLLIKVARSLWRDFYHRWLAK